MCWGHGWPRGRVQIRSLWWGYVVNYDMAHTYTSTIHTGTDWYVISRLSDSIMGPLHRALTKWPTTLPLYSQQLIYLIVLITLLYNTWTGEKITIQPQERRDGTSVTSSSDVGRWRSHCGARCSRSITCSTLPCLEDSNISDSALYTVKAG